MVSFSPNVYCSEYLSERKGVEVLVVNLKAIAFIVRQSHYPP